MEWVDVLIEAHFSEKAQKIGPIPYGGAPMGTMQAPRYTTIEKLRIANKLTDPF